MQFPFSHASRLAYAIALILLIMTAAYWRHVDHEAADKRQVAFDAAADHVVVELRQRLTAYELVLRGVKGLYERSASVSPGQYQHYIQALQLDQSHPGLQGIGVALLVKHADKASHVAAMHLRGFANYQIKPPGERAQYAPITLIEPFAGNNLNAIGFDVGTNPDAQSALLRSLTSGGMALTGKTGLVQDAGKNQPAVVMYIPLLSPVNKDVMGWVSGPFRIADLLATMDERLDVDVGITLYDGDADSGSNRLFGELTPVSGLRTTRQFDIGGRRWILDFHTLPAFEARFNEHTAHAVIAAVGAALSVLLGYLYWLLATGRARAVALAQDMTKELRHIQDDRNATLDALPDVLFETDLAGRYYSFHTSRINFLAVPPKALLGKLITDVLPAPAAAICMASLRDANAIGFSLGQQIELSIGGESRWFELSVARKKGSDADPPRFITISRDITERKQAQEQLRLSEENLTITLQSIGDAVIATNVQGCITRMNPVAERLTGWPLAEATGRPLADVFQTASAQSLRPLGDGGLTQHKTLLARDGRQVQIADSAAPIRDVQGAIVGSVVVFSDVTEQDRLNEALQDSEKSLNEAQALAQIGSYQTDLKTGIWSSSPALDQIFGIEASFVRNIENWGQLMAPGYESQMVDYYDRVVHGDGKFAHDYEIIRPNDGQRRWVSALGDLVYDTDGTPLFLRGTIQDITDRKLVEHALQASLQEKVALLNEVHHRVKNNLQVITSMLRLEAGRSDHPATKSVLKDMQDRIRSLALLHESIYRSGTFAAIDLGHYLKQIATQSFRSLQSPSSTLELRLDLDTVHIGLDQATPCGLLVSELLSNCFKHAFPDGRTGEVCIKLKPTETPGQWHLQVSDTGVGLPEDFETRREKSLGLQLVDSLARQLGGSLQAGPGSVFAVTFTVSAPAPLQIVV